MNDKPLSGLVDDATSWELTDWWRLDLRSVRQSGMLQRSIAVLAPLEARRDEYTRVTAGSCLQTLAYLFALVGPLLGAIVMFRWTWAQEDFDMPLNVAGVLTAIALAIAVFSAVQEHLHPRASSLSAVLTISLMRIVPGAVTIWVALSLGRDLLGPGSWVWLAVVGADVLFHAVMLVRGPTRTGGPQNAIDNIQQGVDELSPQARAAILDERRSAIAVLAERGLIDQQTEARAQASAIGMLGVTMTREQLPKQ